MSLTDSDIKFDSINWLQFEELCYDLLVHAGFHSLKWRKGGNDQGRDIEGLYPSQNMLVNGHAEKWFVECKHRVDGLNVDDISNKLSWAEVERADYFLLMTTGYLTNPARQWLDKKRKVTACRIEVIEGKELKQRLLTFPQLVAKYFLNLQGKLEGIRTQWLHYDVLPDVRSFLDLMRKLAMSDLSIENLGFLLFLFHELEHPLEEWCNSENFQMPNESEILLALRKHRNHEYPILTVAESKAHNISFEPAHYSTWKVERPQTNMTILFVHQQLTHNQLLDVMVKKERKILEVRVSLRE